MMHLLHLPQEIISCIFGYLNGSSCSTTVCRQWYELYWSLFRFGYDWHHTLEQAGILNSAHLLSHKQKDPSRSANAVAANFLEGVNYLLLRHHRPLRSLFGAHFSAGSAFFIAITQGDVLLVKEFLKEKEWFDPSINKSAGLSIAIAWRHYNIVESLLQDPRIDPSANNNYTIKWASRNGLSDIVEILLKDKRVDPSGDDNYSLRWSSQRGHERIVKALLQDKRVDPAADDNYAICFASCYGHEEVCQLLIKDNRIDVSARADFATKWASMYGHYGVVKLLLAAKGNRIQRRTQIKNQEVVIKQVLFFILAITAALIGVVLYIANS